MIVGHTPADPDDRGEADPAFAEALRAGDRAGIATLLPQVRLLVPVVAVPHNGDPNSGGPSAGEAEMAVPHLVNDAGLRALPVFSCLAALRAWQPGARPVPMPGGRVLAAAVAEDYDGLVVDVAGPAPATLDRDDLQRLAAIVRAAQNGPGC